MRWRMPPHKRRIRILLLAGGGRRRLVGLQVGQQRDGLIARRQTAAFRELTRVVCRAYTEALNLCFREPLPVIESSKEKPSWNNPSF